MPAHNTVVVDGVSSYPVMMSQHAFKVVASYPEVTQEQPASKKLSEWKLSTEKDSELKDKISYATVKFLEPETQAQQQRTTAIVKTSAKGGYYIDVFRSKKVEGLHGYQCGLVREETMRILAEGLETFLQSLGYETWHPEMQRTADQARRITALWQVITQAVVHKVGHALCRCSLLHVASKKALSPCHR